MEPSERAPDDDPLPAEDEIPSFLRGTGTTARSPEARDAPPGEEIPREFAQPGEARTGDGAPDDPEASWGYIRVSRLETPGDTEDSGADDFDDDATPWDGGAPAPREGSAEEAAAALPELAAGDGVLPAAEGEEDTEADPCQPIRDAIARYEEGMQRVQAQRQNYAWVGDSEDHAALQLLAGLRRCEEHPDDPDCAQPSMQARSVSASEIGRHPNDLVADGKNPDEIVHDPFVLERLRELRRCEAAHP